MPPSERPGPEVALVERFVSVTDDPTHPLDLLTVLPAALFLAGVAGEELLAELVCDALDQNETDVADGLCALAFVVAATEVEQEETQ